jgi:hypothetical protein
VDRACVAVRQTTRERRDRRNEGGRSNALEELLHLIRQLVLYLLLQPTQEERTKDLVQAIDNEQAFLLVHLHLFASSCKRSVEPLLEVVDRIEDRRKQEVEERPELRQAILQRSACH